VSIVAGAIIALAFAVFGILSMHRYGLTADSPALFYAGDRTLYAALHPSEHGALDLKHEAPAGFKTRFVCNGDPQDPQHYPVLAGFMAASSNALLSRVLSANPVDGHHAALLFIQVVMLFLFTIYACRLLGDVGGIAAGVMLALFPCAVGHSFNNAKDWPCAGYYGITVLAAGVAFVERRPAQMWMAGVFLGVALSFKLNGAFAAITVAAIAPIAYLLLYRGRPFPWRLFVPLALVPVLGFAIFFVAWPWLWHGRPAEWVEHTHEYVRFMAAYAKSKRPTFSAHPFRCLLYMSPPLVLLAAGRGAWPGRHASRERWFVTAVLLIWLMLPLVRVALPYSNYYDANRHFIEYIPALCALGGAGIAALWRVARPFLAARLSAAGLHGVAIGAAAIALAILVWPVAQYHPFESTYFNMLAGGLGGAQRKGLLRTPLVMDERATGTEGDYWMNSLREGTRVARRLAPGAAIGMCAWTHKLAEMESGPQPPETKDFDDGGYAYGIVYMNPRGCWCSWTQIREAERQRPVMYREERDGGLIYEILGPVGPTLHEPVSRPSIYEKQPFLP
jgi:hypothetical protein